MRFAVIGAGAMGGSIGGLLAASGEDVGFLARGAHLDALRAGGLTLVGDSSETWLKAPVASDDPASLAPADAVFLGVKMYDLDQALNAAAAVLSDDGFVVTLQNGIEAPDIAAKRFGAGRVVAGVSWLAARLASPGRVEVVGGMSGRPWLELGEYAGPDGDSERVRALAARLTAAGISAAAVGDTGRLLWQKFCLISATSSAAALTRQAIGAVCADADGRWLIEQAVGETARVARAIGVPLLDGTEAEVVALIASMPAGARPSQLIDLEAGKRLELEWLSGAVRRLGRRAGIATPYHDTAYAALKCFAGGAQT
jgi:2-dehydropantoate 2-reductase